MLHKFAIALNYHQKLPRSLMWSQNRVVCKSLQLIKLTQQCFRLSDFEVFVVKRSIRFEENAAAKVADVLWCKSNIFNELFRSLLRLLVIATKLDGNSFIARSKSLLRQHFEVDGI